MAPILRTVLRGQEVVLPGSIAGIRQELQADPALREEFDSEVEHAPAEQVPAILARWALTTAGEDPAAMFRRLERGEDIGARVVTGGGEHPEVA